MKATIADTDRIQNGMCSCCHRSNPDPVGKNHAVIAAGKLRARMTGKWIIVAFHNIVWCWHLESASGYISLHQTARDSFGAVTFWTLACDDPFGGFGKVEWCIEPRRGFYDPNEAVKAQMAKIHDWMKVELNSFAMVRASFRYDELEGDAPCNS